APTRGNNCLLRLSADARCARGRRRGIAAYQFTSSLRVPINNLLLSDPGVTAGEWCVSSDGILGTLCVRLVGSDRCYCVCRRMGIPHEQISPHANEVFPVKKQNPRNVS